MNDLLGITLPHMHEHGFAPATALGFAAIGMFSLWGAIFWLVIQHMLMSKGGAQPA